MTHMSSHPPESLRVRFGKITWMNLVVCLALFLVSVYGSHVDVFQRMSFVVLDKLVRRFNDTSRYTTLVLVSPKARGDTTFGYPLRPDRLLTLIEAADAAGAAVIGVDFLTDDTTRYASVDEPSTRAPIVWVMRPSPDEELVPLNPLGNRALLRGIAGLSMVGVDVDNVQRRYRAYEESGKSLYVSFARAVATAWCLQGGARPLGPAKGPCVFTHADSTSELIVLNEGVASTDVVDALDLLRAYERRHDTTAAWDVISGKLKGRIVLLGGVDPEDKHIAPDRSVDGVLLQSRMIESELQGGFLREAPGGVEKGVKFGLALFLMVAYVVWSPAMAALIVVGVFLAVVGIATNPSLATGYWLNPLPLTVGIFFEMWFEGHFGHQVAERLGPLGKLFRPLWPPIG